MRIFHDVEDENLSFILSSSEKALDGQFGCRVLDKSGGDELIIERARFVYNDKLELFAEAFANELYRFAVINTLEVIEDESKDA